jgi:hypothetical protein
MNFHRSQLFLGKRQLFRECTSSSAKTLGIYERSGGNLRKAGGNEEETKD